MRTHTAVLGAVLLLTASGCQPAIDLEAEREALLAADRAWAAAAAEGADAERIASFWSDDAKVFGQNEPTIEGKAAIREMVESSMAIPGFSVTWEPDEAVVAPGGGMGYTIGRNRFTVPGPDGEIMATEGRYVTVWRKEVDGQWRCVIDMYNNGPTPEGP